MKNKVCKKCPNWFHSKCRYGTKTESTNPITGEIIEKFKDATDYALEKKTKEFDIIFDNMLKNVQNLKFPSNLFNNKKLLISKKDQLFREWLNEYNYRKLILESPEMILNEYNDCEFFQDR